MNAAPEQPAPPILPNPKGNGGKSTPPLLSKKVGGNKFEKAFVTISRCLIGFLALIIAASLLGHIASRLRLSSQADKTKIITTLSTLKYPDDIQSAKQLCTDQGYTLLQDMISSDGLFLAASFEVTDIKTSGQICDVGMNSDVADGKSRIYVRLVNQNGWKFDNVYLVTRQGNKLGLWYSYIQQHPIITWSQVYSPEIKNASSSIKNIEDFLNNLKEFGELFREDLSATDDQTINTSPADPEQAEILQRLVNSVQDENMGDDDNQQ